MPVTVFSPIYFEALIGEASKSPRLRQHRNLHSSYQDPCQRLFNAIGVDSYIRPHRHSLDPKAEALFALRGLFALVIFDNDGAVQEVVRFGTEMYGGPAGLSVGVCLPAKTWHTIIALEPGSVLLELKTGPFDPDAAKELAAWAPEEQTPDSSVYLKNLHNLVKGSPT